MSIQTEINRIIAAVSAAHVKVSEKGGTTAQPYLVENLAGAIDTIPIGVQLPTLDNPGKASDALSGKEFIDGDGNKITGTIATKTASNLTASGATVTVPAGYYASQATKSVATATQATPSIEVSSAGLITAKATQSAGYVAAGTKSGTKQLTTQGAQTITPGTADKTIASGRYLTGTQTIKGDANLVAGNIKSGVSIFGVAGSYEGSGGGSGGGGDAEMCTVEFLANAPAASNRLDYLNSEGEAVGLDVTPQMLMMGFTITVPAKTPIGTQYVLGMLKVTGGITRLGRNCFYVTGNATITIVG